MGEGDDEKGDLPKLRRREDFHGWKEKMRMFLMKWQCGLYGAHRRKNRVVCWPTTNGPKQEWFS